MHILEVRLDAGVGIEIVVLGADRNIIFQLHMAAEEFGAVVRAVERHDVVEHGAAADAFGGQRLQFVVGREDVARIADLDDSSCWPLLSSLSSPP